jgi:hypothetical protein
MAASSCVATEHWQLHTVQSHETVANVVIGRWVDASLFSVTEEFVQRVESGTLSEFVLGIGALRLADGVVDWTIGGALGGCCAWAVICAGIRSAILVIDGLSGHVVLIGVVSACCSSKRLQVSDYCSQSQDIDENKKPIFAPKDAHQEEENGLSRTEVT